MTRRSRGAEAKPQRTAGVPLLSTGLARLAAVTVAVVALATAMAVGALAYGTSNGKTVPARLAFILPSTKVCVSGHKYTFRLKEIPHLRWSTVTISVNGRHVETLDHPRTPLSVTVKGLPSGTFTLEITAHATDGRTATASRTYRSCPPPRHVLTVSLAGTGSGTVTGSGISCPGTCSHSYLAGSTVTLTAAASAGSSFSGWSGGCSGTGKCTVTMSSGRAVTATFAANPPPSHALTVSLAGSGSGSVSGTGISCPGTCSHSYTAGSTVSLTASPAAGSSFSGWSGGGCSGTGTCTVTMSSDQAVTATFAANAPPPHTLTVSRAGSGSGTVSGSGISCPGTCSSSYASGTMVTLTATADSGSSFGGWSGGGCSGTGTCTVTMSSDQAVTATFDSSSHTLTVSRAGNGSGSVTDNDQIDCPGTCAADYASGSTVVLFATATDGSTFTGWSGAGCTGTAFCVVNMGQSRTVTATFQTNSPSLLTVITWGSGSGSVASDDTNIDCPAGTCAASYAYGTQVKLTATQDSGSTFVGWSGGGCKGTGTCTVTVDSALDVTATFEKNPAASETPGQYRGAIGGFSCCSMSFYVSPNGGSIEDVDLFPAAAPSCLPSGSVSPAPPLGVAAIPIASDGSFTSTTPQIGLVDNQPATFTYTFNGQFSSSTALAGTWRVDVSYSSNGTPLSCSTGTQTFTASWTAGQTSQNIATASPGSYAGSTENTSCCSVRFYVSPDGGSIEDVDIPGFTPSCTPNGSVSPAPIGIASIPLNSDGSFASTTTQAGLVDNQPATFTYTFAGHVHGPAPSTTRARINGIWREDVTYTNNGTSFSCTTNNQSFAAELDDSQTGQSTATASPGRYSGSIGGVSCCSMSFYVSQDSGSIEDLDLFPASAPSCMPSGSVSPAPPVGIASIPISGDGSFASTTTQTGLVDNEPATFTFILDGHFHGPAPSTARARVDGIWRENVTYTNNGTSFSCTTNDHTFAAELDAGQTGQTNTTASPGSYGGSTENQSCCSVFFTVSADSSAIQNVTISTSLMCSPAEPNVSSAIAIPSIPIDPDGSFAYSQSQSGIVNGQAATITFTFKGHVHGPNTSGKTRINGIWREDVTYANNGTSFYCTSNNESFAATQQ